jgi:1-acyl-sn-glycerol-3-phosphate acyltransferase
MKKNSHKKRFLDYLFTIPYVVVFVSILIIFDIIMRITKCFSYRGFRFVELMMCKAVHYNLRILAGVTFHIEKKSEIPKNIPLIVISNHQSMYDVSLLDEIFYEHEPRFISKKELGRFVPAVSFISRHNKTILIDRNDRAQSLRAMQAGAVEANKDLAALCIFPEGTRAKDGVMKPFKSAGLQMLMKQMPEAMIVPVTIDGTWKLLRYNFWPVPYGITITITVGLPEKIEQDSSKQIQKIEGEIASLLVQ